MLLNLKDGEEEIKEIKHYINGKWVKSEVKDPIKIKIKEKSNPKKTMRKNRDEYKKWNSSIF